MRHGFQSTFVTIAPPEHDDLSLLKMSTIIQKGIYNNNKQHLTIDDEEFIEKEKQVGIISSFKQEDLFSDRKFEWEKLPENLKESPQRRFLVAQRMPAQSVFAFNRKTDDLLNKLIKCPQSKDTRHSIYYFER